MWLRTVLVIATVIGGLRSVDQQRRGYLTAVAANVLYAVVAVVHFIQHMNNSEVDWAHLC